MTDLLTPVLSAQWGEDKSWKLSRYEATGGYRALRKALDMQPDELMKTWTSFGLQAQDQFRRLMEAAVK